jgi:5-methyltetrahydrofolate--homocysteine methyltransferase
LLFYLTITKEYKVTFHELLKKKKVLLSDGAWGTEFAKKGLEPGTCPELLNVVKPEIVTAVAQSYVDSGSDIILTNTFGGNPLKLGKYGLDNRTEELNETGVRLSITVAEDKALVFGAIGPTGEFLAPLGTITESELTEVFVRQVKSLARGGVDGIVIETMTDLGEITCALRAVKDNTDLPVVCSMTFDKGLRGYATIMGVHPEEAAETLEDRGADVIGSNCGSGIENLLEIARLIRPQITHPLWIKPNAGIPELINGKTVYPSTPDDMAHFVPELIRSGTNIIGGCCGTTPAHIRRFRDVLDTYSYE